MTSNFNFIVRRRIWGVEVYFLESERLMGALQFDHSQNFALGSIIQARVVRVLSHLNAAMVDLGQGRQGFLKNQHIPAVFSQSKGWVRFSSMQMPVHEKVKAGDLLLVQVDKLPRGEKQYQVTADIGLQSLLWVYRPLGEGSRLQSNSSLDHLSMSIEALVAKESGHWALRSLAGHSMVSGRKDCLELLTKEVSQLNQEWHLLAAQLQKAQSLGLIRQGQDWLLPIRKWLNSQVLVTNNTSQNSAEDGSGNIAIWVSPELKSDLDAFTHLSPGLQLKILTPETWRFLDQEWQIKGHMESAKQPQLALPDTQGGAAKLVFDQHEAMMTVDVNSGNFSAKKRSSVAGYKQGINEKALAQIRQHLSIRNVQGMVLIDWIDLPVGGWSKFKQNIESSLRRDPWIMSVTHMPKKQLTLVERKGFGQTLLANTRETCSACQGVGRVFSPQMYARRILGHIEKIIEQTPRYYKHYLIQLNAEVHQCITSVYNSHLNRFTSEHAIELTWDIHQGALSDFQINPAM